VEGQLGLEKTPEEYVAKMVEVFRLVREVLSDDGTLWLNIGDSYFGSWGNYGGQNRMAGKQRAVVSGSKVPNPAWDERTKFRPPASGKHPILKPKDLVGIPWRLAFALQADGWWLRQDNIWHKPNPMPESVNDRCTKAHEYLFMLTKSERYYFDAEAIKEPASENTNPRRAGNGYKTPNGWDTSTGSGQHGTIHKEGREKGQKDYQHKRKLAEPGSGIKNNSSMDDALSVMPDTRNKRSVWTVPTQGYSEAHFATFPPALIEPCIKAGSRQGGTVLDPFGGAGTTGLVAERLGRNAILLELNPEYAAMAHKRICDEAPLFAHDIFLETGIAAPGEAAAATATGER
jgi:site-specific DNA-methyltransferase (adenine-specific)